MTEVDLAVSWQQLGLVGVVIALVWKVLDMADRRFFGMPKVVAQTACQSDPMYPQRLKEVHGWMREQHEGINRGDLACQWKDRDEVRDMIGMMGQLVEVTKENTRETRVLAVELRKTRNSAHEDT